MKTRDRAEHHGSISIFPFNFLLPRNALELKLALHKASTLQHDNVSMQEGPVHAVLPRAVTGFLYLLAPTGTFKLRRAYYT